MKVRHTLICFFFLSLQDGNTGLTNAQITSVHTGTEGGDITVTCPFSSPGSSMFFCKRECKPEDILIHTTGVRDQRGRYSITYEGGYSLYSKYVFVSIIQLTKSDSGLYSCGLGGSSIKFEIIVVDALLDGSPPEDKSLYTRAGGNIVVGCSFTVSGSKKYFCKEECEEKDILVETTGYTAERGRYSIRYTQRSLTDVSVYVSITQLTESDSGRYRCGLDRPLSPDPYWEFEIIVTDGWASTSTSMLLYAVLIPVIIVILSGLTLIIICIQRNTRPEGEATVNSYTATTTSETSHFSSKMTFQSGD
ncbi:polymeric immunoglobulin receptor-like [Micropterus dolomieu]|uniref:polymeric immunoglobulin receptor-like n=1 Tax=Micropterus dolomieu TaxID=147949 RepID=UPI001E8CF994|nr:polymeric immunoglobulin receptor-like [Micropterus dolomieu]